MKKTIFNQCNEEYFKLIDSIEKAYWLGFAFADGYINKIETKFTFHLSIKDEEHLDKFIKAVNGNPKTKRYYGPYKTSGKSVQFSITNKKFVSYLVKLGCVTKKSLILEYPNLNTEELNVSFLAGYFDGDGCQNSTKITCGSIQFLESIKNYFNIKSKIINHKKCYELLLPVSLFKKTRDVVKEISLSRKNLLYGKHYSLSSVKNKGILNPNHNENLFDLSKLKIPNYTCPSCQKIKAPTSKFCATCNEKNRKTKIIWPNKENLEKLVWEKPTSIIAKELGVSDKAIEKHCKKLAIIKPGPGYWTKHKTSKKS